MSSPLNYSDFDSSTRSDDAESPTRPKVPRAPLVITYGSGTRDTTADKASGSRALDAQADVVREVSKNTSRTDASVKQASGAASSVSHRQGENAIWNLVRVDDLLLPSQALAESQVAHTRNPLHNNTWTLKDVSLETLVSLVQKSFDREGLRECPLPWTIRKIRASSGLDEFVAVVDMHRLRTVFDYYVELSMEKECIYILDLGLNYIAQADLEWMQELLDLGYTTQSLVLLHLDDFFDRPWIRPGGTLDLLDSPEPSESLIGPQVDFHRADCPHHLLTGNTIDASRLPSTTSLVTSEHFSRPELHQRIVSRICGLAGLHNFIVPPRLEDQLDCETTQGGAIRFSNDKTQCSVRYPADFPYMSRCIDQVCKAMAYLQVNGLCCNSWTIVGTRLNARDSPVVELHSVSFQVVKDLQDALRDLNLNAITLATREVFRQFMGDYDQSYLMQMLDDTEASHFFLDEPPIVSEHYTMGLTAIAVQVLSLSLVSYACAHVGILQLEFLLEGLQQVALLGCDTTSLMVVMSLQRLSCLGDMLKQPLRTFSIYERDQFFRDYVLLRSENEERRDLIALPENLIDTFGGSIIIAEVANLDLCLAIAIGGGLVTPTPGSITKFHWSQDYYLKNTQCFSREQTMTIGQLEKNPYCTRDSATLLRGVSPYLHHLGTCRPYWELSEAEVGIQTGQYLNLTGTMTLDKRPGVPLKQHLLANLQVHLWDALERPYGIQISECTGLVKRVPLRIVLADTLSPFVESQRPLPSRWVELKDVHDILQALQASTFKSWYDSLPDKELRASVFDILSRQMVALRPTGVDNEKKYLVVAWWSVTTLGACVWLDLHHRANVWARILEDDFDTATFAYVAQECLQSPRQRCSKTSTLVVDGIIRMLSTELCQSMGVSLTPHRRGLSPDHKLDRLMVGTKYSIGPENARLVAVLRRDQHNASSLTHRSSSYNVEVNKDNLPNRIWRRAISSWKTPRLTESGAWNQVDQGQRVLVSSIAPSGTLQSGINRPTITQFGTHPPNP